MTIDRVPIGHMLDYWTDGYMGNLRNVKLRKSNLQKRMRNGRAKMGKL